MANIKFSYPKKDLTTAELNSAHAAYLKGVPTPTEADIPKAEAPKAIKVKADRLKAAHVNLLHNIHTSTNPMAEAVANQKATPEEVVGALHSSLTTLSYVNIEAEYKKNLAAARTPADKAKVEARWQEIVKAGSLAYASAGLKGVTEADMRGFAKTLTANTKSFTSVVNIANSGVGVSTRSALTLSSSTVATATFVPTVLKAADPLKGVVVLPPNLCAQPFIQGSFSKHFHYSFSLNVSIPYWCPTWTNPFKVCHKTVTLAGVSLNVDLGVGYKVTCCGGEAWGTASVQACASIVGIQFCAGCTATIVGVAGIGRTPGSNGCTYGLGLTAQLKCTFAGITVFFASVPFGYNFNGPCPPLPCK